MMLHQTEPRLWLSHEIPLRQYAHHSFIKNLTLICSGESNDVQLNSTVVKPSSVGMETIYEVTINLYT